MLQYNDESYINIFGDTNSADDEEEQKVTQDITHSSEIANFGAAERIKPQ